MKLVFGVLSCSVAITACILVLYMFSGPGQPVLVVSGDSMSPHIHDGDLVLLGDAGGVGINTYADSRADGYMAWGDYGDVIVYLPAGDHNNTPVMHRAMYWVNESEPMWPGGPPAPDAGYITLGDNNGGWCDQRIEISPMQPVKKEWVLGVVRFDIPCRSYFAKFSGLNGSKRFSSARERPRAHAKTAGTRDPAPPGPPAECPSDFIPQYETFQERQ